MAKRKTARDKSRAVVSAEQIDGAILVIRGQKVLLDEQLAVFYGVEVKRLVEAVKRNIGRFPGDFMFQLDHDEWASLRSQFATLNEAKNLRSRFVTSKEANILRSQNATSSSGHGGRRYPPYAFTEQGVAMLSSVLRSPRAIEVNIEIMRAFVRLRQLLSLHKDLADRLAKLERQMLDRDADVDQQFRHVFSILEQLFTPPARQRRAIGFHVSG